MQNIIHACIGHVLSCFATLMHAIGTLWM